MVTAQTRTGFFLFPFLVSGPFKALTEPITRGARGSHPCYSRGSEWGILCCVFFSNVPARARKKEVHSEKMNRNSNFIAAKESRW